MENEKKPRSIFLPEEKLPLPPKKEGKLENTTYQALGAIDDISEKTRSASSTTMEKPERELQAFAKTCLDLGKYIQKKHAEGTSLPVEIQSAGLKLRPYFQKGYENLSEEERRAAMQLVEAIGRMMEKYSTEI